MADLGKSGIGVDKTAARHASEPVTHAIHTRDVEQEIRCPADLHDAPCAAALPLPSGRIIIGPTAGEPEPPKGLVGEGETVRRVAVGYVSQRIVARRHVVAVLGEVDIVSEHGQAEHVMEVVPSHPG
ncbi:MAG: hypothetical protein C5B57_03455 [Blastocatellia bacterium]|nr:MAG: hypothetical protein C5B57_03455 [Blastocatellia bacterium]